jgi:hypothetical protein
MLVSCPSLPQELEAGGRTGHAIILCVLVLDVLLLAAWGEGGGDSVVVILIDFHFQGLSD